MKPQTKKRATWAAIAVACVGGFEGLRTYVYRDPVGIATYCFGDTKNPDWGRKYTVDKCKSLLFVRLEEFNDSISQCVSAPMSPERRAAVVSFAYNVGVGAACKSTFVRKLNAGDPSACDELLRWTRARGVELPGLVRRRQEERELCLS